MSKHRSNTDCTSMTLARCVKRIVTITLTLEVNDDTVDAAYQAQFASACYQDSLDESGLEDSIKVIDVKHDESALQS